MNTMGGSVGVNPEIGLRLRGRPWGRVKDAVINHIDNQMGFAGFRCGKNKPPYFKVTMSCGFHLKFQTRGDFRQLKRQDIPCPCGDPTHWLIKIEEVIE